MPVRVAARTDLDALCHLEKMVFRDVVYPPFFFRQALDLWPGLLWLAEDETGNAEGYAMGAIAAEKGVAWILSVAVSESSRGKGIGKALLAALLETMRTQGFTTVRLTVHPENPALRMYEQFGFREVSREADYFHANDPRVLMQCHLTGG